ncbi:MAG: AAA family ATPase [Clostridia bacterium]
MKLITRNQYLDKLISVIGTPDIKVITGVRRSGKSKLLEAYRNYVEQNVPDHNIIQINFNLPEFDHLLEYRPLYDYINSQYSVGKENFVLMDNISNLAYLENSIQYKKTP